MSDQPETKELDPQEEIKITRENFIKELYKAQEKGSELKYNCLMNFLFAVCEFYADSFRPQNLPMYKFLGATLNTLVQEFNKKYGKIIEEEQQREAEKSEKPPEGGHSDVQEGGEGRQGADQEDKQEENDAKEEKVDD